MVKFQDDFYADVRIEDRSRTMNSYKAGIPEEIRASIAEQATFMRTSVPVTPGKYSVVLSPEAAGVFAHESFGHKSESDFMLSDKSMRDELQLGKTVGSPILSIAGQYAMRRNHGFDKVIRPFQKGIKCI